METGRGPRLQEIDDEWQVERRYFSRESMRQLQAPAAAELALPSAGSPRLLPVR